MRITGGKLGGRRLASPKSRARPTQDRVRQALFSALAERIPGARALDLFAGSGAFGLEALSRGAAWACWVERNRRNCAALRAALVNLGLGPEKGRIIVADVFRFLRRQWNETPFDVVFADPPYDREGAQNWPERLRREISGAAILKNGGLFVIESFSASAGPEEALGWRLLRRKAYGMTGLDIWMKES